MALKTCKECGKEVSDAELRCPHCGKSISELAEGSAVHF
jgi:DNA-directed RNA polymerase subunit RPC12/RpoP